MRSPKPHRRDGFWYLIRRVPADVAHLDPRGLVRVSTKVRIADDPNGIRAGLLVADLNNDLEKYWRDLKAGNGAAAQDAYDTARARARSFGLDYAPAAQLATRDVDEIVRRVEVLLTGRRIEDGAVVGAVLGAIKAPDLLLSKLVDEYEAHMRASLSDLSADQLRKWRNPLKRATNNLIKVIGDKAIERITRDDALEFRDWWQERITSENLEIETANRDIGSLNRMTTVLGEAKRLNLANVFDRLRIQGGGSGKRTAFEIEFVQKTFLSGVMRTDLNDEARDIVLVIAETGLRLSEVTNLNETTIHLRHNVPHVQVRPDGRRMKTKQSKRDIPLVGVALDAMRRHPKGFPRYRDKSAGLSALVNAALRLHKLLPTEDHTLYSLRHTFKDRMRAVEMPAEMIDELMGHKGDKPDYGAGYSLAHKVEWLNRIVFEAPSLAA